MSVIAVSNVYLFSKIALEEINLLQFGFFWFGFGLIWIILLTDFRQSIRMITLIPRNSLKIYFFSGILETVSTASFFYAMELIENPSVTSFLTNLTPILVVLMSFIFLKERFSKYELAGILFTISGAFIISYLGNKGLGSFLMFGSIYVYLNSITQASVMILVKKNITNLSPKLLTLNRTIFIFFFSVIFVIFTRQSLSISLKTFIALVIGSFLGPFLTTISAYNALKYLEAYKQSLINSSKSLFVLLGSFLIFGKLPMNFQIIGGVFTIIGVILVSLGSKQKNVK